MPSSCHRYGDSVDGVEAPRHRADAVTGTTSRRWRGASGICFHTGRMRVAQSAVLCACGAADWKAAAVEAKQKAIDGRIIQATAGSTAASVTAPSVPYSVQGGGLSLSCSLLVCVHAASVLPRNYPKSRHSGPLISLQDDQGTRLVGALDKQTGGGQSAIKDSVRPATVLHPRAALGRHRTAHIKSNRS